MAEEGSTAQDEDNRAAPDEGAGDEGAELSPESAEPGKLRQILATLFRWHPYIFMGVAAVLAAIACLVYPEQEMQETPPAEYFYLDGVDRLYRVLNPDLPLIAASPADEALGARNAFLNLFVFHREALKNHPSFINPHLLLAESNRIMAEFNPAMATKYYGDAVHAYADAALWESREDTAENWANYIVANFMDGQGNPYNLSETEQEEVALRRARRDEYIRYREAEAEVWLGRPELARPTLESIQREVDSRQRERLRRSVMDDFASRDEPRRLFELGPDQYRRLDLLLARTYDGLGMLEQARAWYLRYLGAGPDDRDHAFVMERLAAISLGDGEVYRRVDATRAETAYAEAVRYYTELAGSPASDRDQHYEAVKGLALANSRLAGLVPSATVTGVDELGAFGRRIRGWLEEFSGQPLPRRTLVLPVATGETLAEPELMLPTFFTLPAAVGGTLSAMAGGRMTTPHERRRVYLTRALENYDRIAEMRAGTPEGDQARVNAAWESWRLGLKRETEARLEKMLAPLSSAELILAARVGLAMTALDKGELERAHMLVLGGYAHPLLLWFTPPDADWRKIASSLGNAANRAAPGAWRRVWETISDEGKEIAAYSASGRRLDDVYVGRFLRALNTMLRRRDFYQPESFPASERNFYLTYLLERDPDLLTAEDIVWRNRLLLEEAWPYDLSQRAAKGSVGFEPLPPGREIPPGSLLDTERIRDVLTSLGAAWTRAANRADDRSEKLRMLLESVSAYEAAVNLYGAEPGDTLYELARNFEALAELVEARGDHLRALSLTATAARTYLDVSLKARGTERERESLLAAGDAFFRSGLLERTVESQARFLDRFGYAAVPGTDGAMMVVRAENLLGRAYWFMNDIEKALESFRRNIPRRTPDRFKSIYYIGRVLMDEGVFKDEPSLLGDVNDPMPELDRYGDPVVRNALQAFTFLRQSQGINPEARAWRWSTFDLARLRYVLADRARRAAQAPPAENAQAAPVPAAERGEGGGQAWLALYDAARLHLTEALERYPLRRNGGLGLSVRVEPEDYADVMASRFEAEFLLANTLLTLGDARRDDSLLALARAHLENLRDRNRYAGALFDTTLDRFQLNAAVVREEIEGGNWDRAMPLPRSRLGDDEGPTHDPRQLRGMLANSMLLLASEYFRAGERAAENALSADGGDPTSSSPYYRDAYRAYQDVYDRFGPYYGPQAMVGMGDALNRMGMAEDAGNHYRMARNMTDLLPEGLEPAGGIDLGPEFWGATAEQRLRDMEGGYRVP